MYKIQKDPNSELKMPIPTRNEWYSLRSYWERVLCHTVGITLFGAQQIDVSLLE